MIRKLSMTTKLLSFRGEVNFDGDAGTPGYRASSAGSLLRRRWHLHDGQRELAVISSARFAWNPAWQVSGAAGVFAIERRWLSMRRQYRIVGGPFDGATIAGNLLDLRFAIEIPGGTLARAAARLLTLRDKVEVEILRPDAELTCVIAMLVVQIDRAREARGAAADPRYEPVSPA